MQFVYSRVLKWTTFLTALLVFGLPIEHKYDKLFRHSNLSLIPEGLSLPPGFDQKIYFYISDIVSIILFTCVLFAFKIPMRRIFLEKGASFLWVIFFCAAISITLSPLSHYPVVYTRLLQILTPILLFTFFTQTHLTEKNLKILFSLFVFAGLIQCSFAIMQYFSQEPLGLRILSESRDAPATFDIASGKRWLFDSPSSMITIKRAIGTLPHCNILGGFLALSIIISYSLIALAKKTWKKYAIGLTLIIQFFALSISYSRSAIYGVVLGTIVWFAWAAKRGNIRSYRFLSAMIAISITISAALLSEQYLHRGGIINYNTLVQNSDQVRIKAQTTAIKMILDHPFFGIGYQQFSGGSAAYVAEGSDTPGTHNIYLFLAAETGIFALLAFLGFIASVLFKALKAPFSPQLASLLSIFVMFLFIGGCDFYPILSQQGKLMFFLTASLLVAEAQRVTQSQEKIEICQA